MKRRIIRSFFIGLLLFFVATVILWVRSYFFKDILYWGTGPYSNARVKEVYFKSSQGMMEVGDYRFELFSLRGKEVTASDYADWTQGSPSVRTRAWYHFWHSPELSIQNVIGFDHYRQDHPPVVDEKLGVRAEEVWRSLEFPFWFPATISAALLWWAWRKTPPKINPARAFPVELRKSRGQP